MIWATIEGIDGAGKTALAEALGAKTAFPSARAREALAIAQSPTEKRAIFFGDMGLQLDLKGRAFPRDSQWITDRGPLSTIAYGALDNDDVPCERLIRAALSYGLFVDVVFYVDVPVTVALERQRLRGGMGVDDIGGAEGDFKALEALAESYNTAITRFVEACVDRGHPGPDVVILDGRRPTEDLAEACIGVLKRILSGR